MYNIYFFFQSNKYILLDYFKVLFLFQLKTSFGSISLKKSKFTFYHFYNMNIVLYKTVVIDNW